MSHSQPMPLVGAYWSVLCCTMQSGVDGDRSKDAPSKQATGVVPTTKGDGSNLAVVPVLTKPTEGNKQVTN